MASETIAPEGSSRARGDLPARGDRSDRTLRDQVHRMWAAVAAPWDEHADYVERRAVEVTDRMLSLTAPRPGESVLELACGAGGLGLAAAPLVQPGGRVVLSDVVPEMATIAERRARTAGFAHVSTAVLDLEGIDQPDASYEVVLCREGLMFAADPTRAAGEIRRVLRQGGRTAVAVWASREQNPWLAVVFDAVTAETGAPVPPPGVPGPFALGDAGMLAKVLTAAGLRSVVVTPLSVPARDVSFESFWSLRTALAGPLQRRLAALPAPTREAIRQRVEDAVRPYQTSAGLEIPGVCLVGYGIR